MHPTSCIDRVGTESLPCSVLFVWCFGRYICSSLWNRKAIRQDWKLHKGSVYSWFSLYTNNYITSAPHSFSGTFAIYCNIYILCCGKRNQYECYLLHKAMLIVYKNDLTNNESLKSFGRNEIVLNIKENTNGYREMLNFLLCILF